MFSLYELQHYTQLFERKVGWGGGGGVGDGGVDQDSASGDLCSSKYGTFYSLGFEKRQVAFQ